MLFAWKRARIRLLVLVVMTLTHLVVLLGSPAARADAKAEARERFNHSLELVDEGRYAEAIVELQRCYELSPHYAVHYNIAQAYVMLGKPVAAVAAFDRYLEEGGDRIDDARRSAIEEEIERQRARTGALEIRVSSDGALVSVDDETVGLAPLAKVVPADPGSHVVSATLAGYAPASKTVSIAGGDQRHVDLMLVPLRPEEPPPDSVPEGATEGVDVGTSSPPQQRDPGAGALSSTAGLPLAPEQRAPAQRRVGIGVAGAGLVTLAISGAVATHAQSIHDEALDAWRAEQYDRAEERQASAVRTVRLANVGFVTSAVLVAAGGVVFGTAPSRRRAPSGSLRLQPLLGAQQAGLVATGIW